MALRVEVNRFWPTLDENGVFRVGVEVILYEDGDEVRRATFAQPTAKGADVTSAAAIILAQAQRWIDAYKTEKATYADANYEALRAAVQSGLVV